MTTGSGVRNLIDGSIEGEVGATIYGMPPRTPVDFRPAGGAPGLDRPDGSGGRRGSVGKSLGLAGGGVSRSIRPDVGGFAATGTRALAMEEREHDGSGVRFGDEVSSSIGGEGGYDRGADVRCAESPDAVFSEGVERSTAMQSAKLTRRRQSNTGQLRELVESWPEAAAAAPTDDQRSSSGTVYDNGNLEDTPGGPQHGVAELRRDIRADYDGTHSYT